MLESYLVNDSSEQEAVFALPEQSAATPGEHSLSISLLARSSTTFRLYAADIRGIVLGPR